LPAPLRVRRLLAPEATGWIWPSEIEEFVTCGGAIVLQKRHLIVPVEMILVGLVTELQALEKLLRDIWISRCSDEGWIPIQTGEDAILDRVVKNGRANQMAARQVRHRRAPDQLPPPSSIAAHDILARLTGQWLSEHLGQPFIIENRPGANGNLGADDRLPARD
jgi:hypothetical protein